MVTSYNLSSSRGQRTRSLSSFTLQIGCLLTDCCSRSSFAMTLEAPRYSTSNSGLPTPDFGLLTPNYITPSIIINLIFNTAITVRLSVISPKDTFLYNSLNGIFFISNCSVSSGCAASNESP
jgi:hypothetical protein